MSEEFAEENMSPIQMEWHMSEEMAGEIIADEDLRRPMYSVWNETNLVPKAGAILRPILNTVTWEIKYVKLQTALALERQRKDEEWKKKYRDR